MKPARWIKNFEQLALTPQRELVLQIAEAGFDAIDTEKAIGDQVRLINHSLIVKNSIFDLEKFENIYVIGFGKASCKAAFALEKILGNKIRDGIAIGLKPLACEFVKTYEGTHPQPSEQNVRLANDIVNMAGKLKEKDLVITIVSGGGSALLCWPMEECKQAYNLYEKFLPSGGGITELNTVRKHISLLKGGGLAKILHPATVLGLIFSDVPGNDFSLIASGPTYKDNSTVADAQAIIEKYGLGEFRLTETPKEEKYFKKVTNIPLVSNLTALNAMKAYAEKAGITANIISSQVTQDAGIALDSLENGLQPNAAALAGGEIRLVVTKKGGKGGRNLYLGMAAIDRLGKNDIFAAIASDGMDNSDCAGVILDFSSRKKLEKQGLNLADYIQRYDGYSLFEKLGAELIFTGPTDANVSDLMIWFKSAGI